MPKISIIIPVYNCCQYLDETLSSVFLSTFQDFEVILINDGSTDGSYEKCLDWGKKDPRIKVLDQQNAGVVTARNNGISHACSPYIFPLDSDDKIAPSCLEKLINIMETQHYDVIYSQVLYFGEKTGLMQTSLPLPEVMIQSNVVVCSALYRKSDWENYGGYDIAFNAAYEDWGFWLNFIEDGKSFYRVNEPLFFYRIRNISRNHTIDSQKIVDIKKYIKEKHKKLYDKYESKVKIINKLNKILKKLMRIPALFLTKSAKKKLLSIKIPYRFKR